MWSQFEEVSNESTGKDKGRCADAHSLFDSIVGSWSRNVPTIATIATITATTTITCFTAFGCQRCLACVTCAALGA